MKNTEWLSLSNIVVRMSISNFKNVLQNTIALKYGGFQTICVSISPLTLLYHESVVGFTMKRSILLTLQILVVTWICLTKAQDEEDEINNLRAELVSHFYFD